MLISLPELVRVRCFEEMETNLFKQLKLQAKSFDCYAFVMSKSTTLRAVYIQNKTVYLCQ